MFLFRMNQNLNLLHWNTYIFTDKRITFELTNEFLHYLLNFKGKITLLLYPVMLVLIFQNEMELAIVVYRINIF